VWMSGEGRILFDVGMRIMDRVVCYHQDNELLCLYNSTSKDSKSLLEQRLLIN
jgi:hypothetical protein